MIHRLILNDIDDEDEKATFKASTLTPIATERVKIDGNDEHTKNTILRGGVPVGLYKIELSKEKSEVKEKPGKSGTVSWKTSENVVREAVKKMNANLLSQFIDRWHVRIVFKEFAVPFYKLRKLNDMLLVLEHSVEGRLCISPI